MGRRDWLYDLDRWANQIGPHIGIFLAALLVVLLLEARMLQDALKKAEVREPSFMLTLLVAVISIPLCTVVGLLLSFIPILGWIGGLLLNFAMVGGLCALFFGCTWGKGFYAAFWWWLYHVIFVLVVGGILLALGLAFGIAVANR